MSYPHNFHVIKMLLKENHCYAIGRPNEYCKTMAIYYKVVFTAPSYVQTDYIWNWASLTLNPCYLQPLCLFFRITVSMRTFSSTAVVNWKRCSSSCDHLFINTEQEMFHWHLTEREWQGRKGSCNSTSLSTTGSIVQSSTVTELLFIQLPMNTPLVKKNKK